MYPTNRMTRSRRSPRRHLNRSRWAILLACVPFALGAQTTSDITGRIVDRESGQALSGAHISLPGTTQGAVSRADGTYRLPLLPGRHVVFVSYVGYAPRRDTVDVQAEQSLQRDYALDRGVSQLDAAVVIGTRSHDRTVLNSPVPVDVLTQRKSNRPDRSRRARSFSC